MKYQGLSGTVYEVEEKRLAGGGEGNVHAIIGNDKQVAKIFKVNKRDTWREEKLRLMLEKKLSEEQMRQITWPQDVIYNRDGFAGYIMPKLINASSLTELYTEEKYDLRFRLMAAVNLCEAIDTVHHMGQVCGDLNPQNIFVNLDKNDRQNGFKVTLVDTDSYHFTANGTTYRCEVGLGDYIAPELQNKMAARCDLRTVPLPSYTRETDLFALAVHIFCLLMNGCHPFACARDTSPGESNISRMTAGRVEDSIVCPQPIDNIKNGFFPFYEKRQGTVIPVYAPEFESLPDEIRTMFVRTFVDGYSEPLKRVTASEWSQALRKLTGRVRQCSKVVSEYYFDHVSECPLCKVRERLSETVSKPDDQGWSEIDLSRFEKMGKTKRSTPGVLRGAARGILAWVILFVLMLLIIGIAAVIDSNTNKNMNANYETDTEENQNDRYRQLISNASAAFDSGEYDQVLSYCDEAAQIETSDEISKKQAYYWRGKALYAKGDLEQALAFLQTGQAESYDEEIETAYNELIEEIKKKKIENEAAAEAAAEKARAEAKKLKKLNRIISAIKKKEYKSAGNLAYKYCENHSFGRIYVQDGKIVKTIKSGKGFLIKEDYDLAYYGSFKNGRRSGKGIEVGKVYGECYKIQGKYKNNKLNGRASIYMWNHKLGNETYHTQIAGNYKNNKENGQMTITYYYRSGGVMNTYYMNSSNGKRRIIRYDSDVGYVFGQNQNYYIGNKEKKWLLRCGHPAYFYT